MKPFPLLAEEARAQVVEKLHHWSLANGLVMYPPDFDAYNTDIAPVTLFPTPFPRDAFDTAHEVQPLFNKLYAKVASDHRWLDSIINQLIEHDKNFTGRLWDTYQRARQIGIAQPLSLGLVRSDYMLDQITSQIKQIEYNAISVSFGGLSPRVAGLHRYLNAIGAYDGSNGSSKYYDDSELASTQAVDKLAEGLANANHLYHAADKNDDDNAASTIVLVVVQDKERNVFDQRHLEYILVEKYGVKSQRTTFSDAAKVTKVDPETKKLIYIPTNDEISIVYYRSGYGPSDYQSDSDWATRLHLETSKAIKCPTLISQITGSKKIQQLLTDKQILAKYLSEDEIDSISRTFVDLLPLDDSEAGKRAKKLAFEEPEKYVLKPQREGGGNNIYKEDIPKFLKTIPENEWSAYILMSMIAPPSHKNLIVRKDHVYREDVVSELGVFGTVIWNSETGEVHANKTGDYLLRSKFSSSNEGGVAAGFGCVDSIYLY